MTFRQLRILILLLILAFVAAENWHGKARTTDWDTPLWVVIYPINADSSPASAAYIEQLREDDFQPIEDFMRTQARRFGISLDEPVVVNLAPEVASLPPQPPDSPAGPLAIAWWSLKMRWWAWRADTYAGPGADIRLFVNYFDAGEHRAMPDSHALEKGRLSVINAFASRRQRAQNQVILNHEMLHTLGATDKYDLRTNLPLVPQGLAEPQKQPRYPQRLAELMGGRIALSETHAVMPASLRQCMVGELTAREIGWLPH